jgi:AcrR family transcriptional regulator
MGLLEEHKAERKGRILAAARELIAERGYDGLTMRDLARASRVSVPTLYNLFGGKQAIILGELEATFAAVTAGFEGARGGTFVAQAFAACEAGNRDVLSAPAYSRELVHLFVSSPETRPLRRQTADQYVALMAGHLAEARRAGEVVEWVDPQAVARRMFSHYTHAMMEFAQGELDAEEFQAATLFGMALMLLGIVRGRAARDLTRRAKALQSKLGVARKRRARQGG